MYMYPQINMAGAQNFKISPKKTLEKDILFAWSKDWQVACKGYHLIPVGYHPSYYCSSLIKASSLVLIDEAGSAQDWTACVCKDNKSWFSFC